MDFATMFFQNLEHTLVEPWEIETLLIALFITFLFEIIKELWEVTTHKIKVFRVEGIIQIILFDFILIFFFTVLLSARFEFFIVPAVILFSRLVYFRILYKILNVSDGLDDKKRVMNHDDNFHHTNHNSSGIDEQIQSILNENNQGEYLTNEDESNDEKYKEEIQELFSKLPINFNYSTLNNPTILEILLLYGYISQNHKDIAELNNIFDTPDEIAEHLKTMYVITDEQLKEARGIMNIVRRKGRLISREEAAKILSMHKLPSDDKKENQSKDGDK
jgi:hypothetical protein